MKDFFKMLGACLLALFVAGMGMFVLFLGFIGIVAASTEPAPKVEKNAMLVFDLSANITDSPVSESGEQLIAEALGSGGPPRLQLRKIVAAIDAAATDNRIKGLYLHGSVLPQDLGSGYAAILDVRAAVERFRAAGKPVTAYLVAPNTRDFLLASTADRVVMNPMGMMMMPGLAAEVMYFGGTFEKYGIGVQVARAGQYKSAGEAFVLDHMSPEEREQLTALLDDIWAEIIVRISRSRSLEDGVLQGLIDREALISAQDALEAGLIDETRDFSELLGDLKAMTGEGESDRTFKQVAIADYIKATGPLPGVSVRGPKIAVVYAEGEIVDGEGSTGTVGGDRLARELRSVRADDEVKAVVLRVNSPGGSAIASDVIRRELTMLRSEKPLVVSMGTVAASGGYWISAGSDRIFAQPNTITGSIGVIAMIPNVQGLTQKVALNVETVQTGRNADIFSLMKPRDEEAMAIIQERIGEVYGQFLDLVAAGRKMDRTAVAAIAGGRVWSGADAVENGLVDELGSLKNAVEYAASLAQIEKYSVIDHPTAESFLEQLQKMLEDKGSPLASRGPAGELRQYLSHAMGRLELLNDPQGVYALMPQIIELN